MERKVRAARASKADAQEDHSTLTQLMHDVRARKEMSERQLGKMRRMLEEAKRDWQKKMRDRKKEVQELKRRQERDELRELKRCAAPRVSLPAVRHSRSHSDERAAGVAGVDAVAPR